MRIKYYLRGLGIGIFVTALIFTIANHLQPSMTDEEIKKKAAELGMVMQETDSGLFPSQSEDDTTTEAITTSDNTQTTEEVTTPEQTEAITVPVSEETTSQVATQPVTEAPTVAPTETPTEAPTVAPTEAPTAAPAKTYTLVIRSGMGSDDVARVLSQQGIVAGYQEFDDYLCSHSYNGRRFESNIICGTYTVNSNMTYEQIARLICGL